MLAVLGAVPGGLSGARAQELVDNGFTLDAFEGPFRGGARLTAIAGSHAGTASWGLEGAPFNPAAYANRELWDQAFVEVEPWVSLSLEGATTVEEVLDRTLRTMTQADLLFAAVGLGLKVGPGGLGTIGQGDTRAFEAAGRAVESQLTIVHFGAAYGFFDSALQVGLGGRTASLSLTDPADDGRIFAVRSTSLELGVLLRPPYRQWRLGAALRTEGLAVTTDFGRTEVDDDGVVSTGGFIVPGDVTLPWQFELGFTYAFSERPLNAPWTDPRDYERGARATVAWQRAARARADGDCRARGAAACVAEAARRGAEQARLEAGIERWADARWHRLRELPRPVAQVWASLVVSGPVERGVSLDDFVGQRGRRSGRGLALAPALGFELEVVPDRLKLRAGGYLVPPRVDGTTYLPHVTLGGEVRLFDWDAFGLLQRDWRVGVTGAIDVGQDYFDWSVALVAWQ
jgi:hypothetical protein